MLQDGEMEYITSIMKLALVSLSIVGYNRKIYSLFRLRLSQ